MRGTKRNATIAIAVLLVATIISVLLLFKLITEEKTASNSATTLTGELTCLPHKDTGGPVTLECALGLLADDGRYFALKGIDHSQDYTTGQNVVIYGLLSNPGPNEKYNISGIVQVQSVSKN